MFKRLFLLSGIMAFFLAGAMMWFWYLPMKEHEKYMETIEKIDASIDSISVALPDSIAQ